MAVVAAALAFAPAASAVTPITDYFNQDSTGACPTYGEQQICSGQVPSFDGAKLDVDLTLPEPNGSSSHPLIVLLHGFGNNKHEWESTTDDGDGADKYQWNSHWFAKHGYYVLTYTARGFKDQGRDRDDEPDTPSFTSQDPPRGTIHLKSREFEIRDTQWLAALVAGAYPDVARDQIAVSGGSYGGGESWLQASQADWTFPNEQTGGELPVLRLQVAVPKYPWTDLAYSLAPNGHPGFGPNRGIQDPIYESSQCAPDDDVCAVGDGNPTGVVKFSFVNGFFTLGGTKGEFEELTAPGPEEGPYSTSAWFGRLVPPAPGEPYDVPGDALIEQVRRGLTEFRGSYYQDEGWKAQADSGREVAVFSIQGWTDDLFEAVESFRQFKYLKRLDPKWPVAVAVADVGHSRAQNLPDTWVRLNNQAWQFLQANIDGADKNQQTNVTSQPTVCEGANTPTQALTASTPESLAAGTLTVTFTRGDSLTSVGGLADELNGVATDPVFGSAAEPGDRCRRSNGPALGGYTAYSQPLKNTRTYIGLGWVQVPYTFTGHTGQLDTRIWDVPPSGDEPGDELLVTRGTYRFSVPMYDSATGTIRLPLFGNHWVLTKGHRIRVDLTQVDQPFLRPSNEASAITFGPPRLVLPTRESGDVTLAGG